MNGLNIFFFEWKHFSRSPFKLIALLLFVVAAVYGLHNGASLYQAQTAEIAQIREKAETDRQQYLDYYDEGKAGPEDRPWIDITIPFWAIWYNGVYHFKTPSPAMVYSIGQAEQYGFYKRVTFWASPYDSDMTQEIANPERLQTGTLDFAFTLIFLLPLLLLILLYNLQSAEAEQGFLPLIEVQATSRNSWLLSRVAFYVVLLVMVLLVLLLYGAMLTPVFASAGSAFGQMILYSMIYLLFWSLIYYLLLRGGTSIMGNTLKMATVWLALAFLIPGVVHQWISLKRPTNLMTEFIDAKRDDQDKLFQQPDSVLRAQLFALFPEIADSPVVMDSTQRAQAMNSSASALANELKKASIRQIEADNRAKNQFVRSAFWFNPIAFFQNQLNLVSGTHYDNYQTYRDEIQALIDKQIRTMVLDTWDSVAVDKNQYLAYHKKLSVVD